MDLSLFATAEAWISLVTLIFLEIVLGVDNLVFISITSNRLPETQRHLGRRIGLLGALVMRCLFLCFASWLIHITEPLFTIDLGFYSHGFSLRDIILFVGGLYLVYKGIDEVRGVLRLDDVKANASQEQGKRHEIGLLRALVTIMAMDTVLSIDSVITAVGLANHLIIMILAVVIAILFMFIFIDFIADFLNSHIEMKILALCFIAAIGVLLVLDGLGIQSDIEIFDMRIEKLVVYFAMVFSFVITLIQMRYTKNLREYESKQPEERLGDAQANSECSIDSVHEKTDLGESKNSAESDQPN